MTDFQIIISFIIILGVIRVYAIFGQIRKDDEWLNEHCKSNLSDEDLKSVERFVKTLKGENI